MALPYGIVTKKVVDAINAATTGVATGVTAVAANGAAITTLQGKFVSAPASAAAAGVAGSISYDATHIYVCVATNTWVRATLATW